MEGENEGLWRRASNDSGLIAEGNTAENHVL